MAKKKPSKETTQEISTETPETVEESTIEQEQPVMSVEEVIPEAPEPEEAPVVEKVVEEIADGMVKIEIVHGSVGIVGMGTFEPGDTVVVSETVAANIDPRFIKIV